MSPSRLPSHAHAQPYIQFRLGSVSPHAPYKIQGSWGGGGRRGDDGWWCEPMLVRGLFEPITSTILSYQLFITPRLHMNGCGFWLTRGSGSKETKEKHVGVIKRCITGHDPLLHLLQNKTTKNSVHFPSPFILHWESVCALRGSCPHKGAARRTEVKGKAPLAQTVDGS